MRANPPKTLFNIDPSTKLIKRLHQGIKSPEYIYGNNWAAESIKFFTVKINDSWRPMVTGPLGSPIIRWVMNGPN